MTSKRQLRWGVVALIAGATALLGCTGEDDAGTGDLTLAVSGGAALRDGFPYMEGDATFAFADGWTLQFSKYVVAVGNVTVSEPGGGPVASWAGPAVLDLKKGAAGSVDLTTLGGLPAIRYDIGFEFVTAAAAADRGNLSEEDFALMSAQGWSFLVEGTAVHPTKGTVDFRFGLPAATRYYECVNGKDMTQGIAIEADKTTGAFIYSHAVHMFWDTLGTGDEDLRFDAFAAVRGDDGLVTEEELKNQDLNDLKDENGDRLLDESGKSIFYNDGGKLPPGQQTLYHFLIAAVRSSAHFNGIGLCKEQVLGQ